MAEMTKDEMLKVVENSISNLEEKNFKIYFYVLDTKGNPSSSLEYIYQTAYALNKKGGYDVAMLHNEDDFVGVGGWLGEEYANLKHYNIKKKNVEMRPCDFLVIPEIFANVMVQTKKLSCKKIILIQNYNHICEFLPVSMTPESLGITDAIVTTKVQEKKVNDYFPNLRTHVVPPSIKPVFRDNDAPRKLAINVISKDQSKVNQIVKPFYWKNPIYSWVSFRDLRGYDIETFAELLRDAAITIWVDDDTNFGYTLLEALKCGSLVLAKIPEHPSDWMLDEEGNLTKSILWFEDIDDIPKILPNVVRSWTTDKVPSDVYDGQKEFADKYTEDQQERVIEDVYVNTIIAKRLADFKEVKTDIENNVFLTNNE
jgi:hypothetical protein